MRAIFCGASGFASPHTVGKTTDMASGGTVFRAGNPRLRDFSQALCLAGCDGKVEKT
jgi:hypothetical protein